MPVTHRVAAAFLFGVCASVPGAAQELPPPIRTAAVCAPVPTAPDPDAPRIVGGRGPSPRTLFGTRDRVVVNAGTERGLQVGERYFVRRAIEGRGRTMNGEMTAGWVTVMAADEQTAIATVDFACGDISTGDHLEPYVALALPAGIDRTDTSGMPDFSTAAHVLYGDHGRTTAGVGDFVVTDIGKHHTAEPGARYAIYRDQGIAGVPPVAVGEAVVVSAPSDGAVIRLTQTLDAVVAGDLLVPRAPSQTRAPAPAENVPQEPAGEGGASDTNAGAGEPVPPARSYTFEDVHFEFDRHTLRAEALRTLDQAVSALAESPTLRLQIEGHTCSIGTAEYNLALADRRAKAVRDYLISRGVAESRLTAISYGEERPEFDNSQEETRKQNRRAALVVSLQP